MVLVIASARVIDPKNGRDPVASSQASTPRLQRSLEAEKYPWLLYSARHSSGM